MAVVRRDEIGLYVVAGGRIARPGNVVGYSHAFRMDDGGLKVGDKVKARHIPQTPLTKVTLDDGAELRWHHWYPKKDPLNKIAKRSDAPGLNVSSEVAIPASSVQGIVQTITRKTRKA